MRIVQADHPEHSGHMHRFGYYYYLKTMINNPQWILPEGIHETLPPEALAIELHRQKLLHMFFAWGYDLVDTPLIDFYDSLVTGTGHDLRQKTFSLSDQMSNRLLGIRSDITPQVARIDAHHITYDHPVRFCYIGKVLHTRLEDFARSRSPIQIGAEIYGHARYHSDVEIISLMLSTLDMSGIQRITLDLGHIGIFQSLIAQMPLTEPQRDLLLQALEHKAMGDLSELLTAYTNDTVLKNQILALCELHGGIEVIQQARNLFDQTEISAALEELNQVVLFLQRQYPHLDLFIDLAELRGFTYHTGLVFAAYLPGQGQAVALGGRYNDIGKAFGRPRPATGFSTDLDRLVNISRIHEQHLEEINGKAIYAPACTQSDMQLEDQIAQLRVRGERVIRDLPGQHADPRALGCNREIIKQNDQWQVVHLSN